MTSRRRVDFPQPSWGRGPHGQHMAEGITIRGQATLEWGDQIRFLARPLARVLLGLATFMVVGLGAVWALTLPDDQWLALRVHPLMSLERFVAIFGRSPLACLPSRSWSWSDARLSPSCDFRTPIASSPMRSTPTEYRPEMPPTSRSGYPGHLFYARATRPEFFISIPPLAVRAPCCGALSRPRIAIRSCAGRNVRTGKLRLDWVK
jgi:hypothetical protein